MVAQRRICTFVDWENIRISLRQNFLPLVTAKQIAGELIKLVEEQGEWRGGNTYAEWTKQKGEAHEFEDAGFHARMVCRSEAGRTAAT